MSKRFEREGTKSILHSCPRGDPPSCRLQTIAIQQNTFGHFWTPWTLGALHKFHSAYMSLASQVMSQWIKHCYSIGVFDSLALQRQGRLGKTPRLGPRGQFSEARSFHSFNENVALHIMLPSLKLTYHLKIDGWKTTFVWGRPIFRGYVCFRESTWHVYNIITDVMMSSGSLCRIMIISDMGVVHGLDETATKIQTG